MGGKRPVLLAGQRALILKRIAGPCAQSSPRQGSSSATVRCGRSSTARARAVRKSLRAERAQQSARWRSYQQRIDAERLVFIDE
jgi:hypothetical protein